MKVNSPIHGILQFFPKKKLIVSYKFSSTNYKNLSIITIIEEISLIMYTQIMLL